MLLPEALHAPSHVGLLGAGHFVQCRGQWREQGIHDRAAALTVSSGAASRPQRPVSVRGAGAVTCNGSVPIRPKTVVFDSRALLCSAEAISAAFWRQKDRSRARRDCV